MSCNVIPACLERSAILFYEFGTHLNKMRTRSFSGPVGQGMTTQSPLGQARLIPKKTSQSSHSPYLATVTALGSRKRQQVLP